MWSQAYRFFFGFIECRHGQWANHQWWTKCWSCSYLTPDVCVTAAQGLGGRQLLAAGLQWHDQYLHELSPIPVGLTSKMSPSSSWHWLHLPYTHVADCMSTNWVWMHFHYFSLQYTVVLTPWFFTNEGAYAVVRVHFFIFKQQVVFIFIKYPAILFLFSPDFSSLSHCNPCHNIMSLSMVPAGH